MSVDPSTLIKSMLHVLEKGEVVEEDMNTEKSENSNKVTEIEKNEELEKVNKEIGFHEFPNKVEEMVKNEELVKCDEDLGPNSIHLTTISNGSKGEAVPETVYGREDTEAEGDRKQRKSDTSDKEEGSKVEAVPETVYGGEDTEAEGDEKQRKSDSSDKEEDGEGCKEVYNNAAKPKLKKRKRGRKQYRVNSYDTSEEVDANTQVATKETKKRKSGRKKQMLSSSIDEDDKGITGSISYDDDDGKKGNIKRPKEGGERRGRKRKLTKSYAHNEDGSTGSTRVLRSNSKAKKDFNISKTSKGQLIPESKMQLRERGQTRKSLGEGGDIASTGSHDSLSVSNIGGVRKSREIIPIKNSKRGRGRPPKLQEHSKSNDSFEAIKPERRGRPSKLQEHSKSNDSVEAIKPERRGRPSKLQEHSKSSDSVEAVKPKRRRGRPSKVQEVSGDHEVVILHDDLTMLKAKKDLRTNKNVEGSQESDNEVMSSNICGDVVQSGNVSKSSMLPSGSSTLACHSLSASERVVVEGIQEDKHQDTGKKQIERSTTQKNLLREQIVSMLKAAGWTVQFRPRNDRNYNRVVYVSPEGNSYWSVTHAYRMLKKKVESGHADSATNSAFSVIPEEEFTTLLRKTTPRIKKEKVYKNKDIGSEPSVTVDSKKKLKRAAEEKKINSSHTRKRKLDSARKHSTKSHNEDKKLRSLLVRECDVDSDNEDCALYEGKRNLLSWMIDMGTIMLDCKVRCMKQNSTGSLKGRISKEGIHCDCCNKIFSMSDFSSHAGHTTSQPLQTICLESGNTLMQCLLNSWNKFKESECFGFHFVDFSGEDPNDDTCIKCGDGGNLICCDGCPSAFHQNCLNIEKFTSGDWHCVYCKCKFCDKECVSQKDDKCLEPDMEMLICCLCEQKYHKLCAPDNVILDVDSSFQSFCGKKCQEIFNQLQLRLGVKYQLEEGFSWRLLRLSGETQDELSAPNPTTVQRYSELAVSYTILDECFQPIVDPRSGTDMIRNVVYSCGSNMKRINYSGFLTAILERDDELISVASIRIHGSQLAEMPFIGTRHKYRRQGMCRRILNAIESALGSLNVEKLVIPAIPELLQTWKCAFGFEPLHESSKKETERMSLIVFPGVDMLQKFMPVQQLHENDLESAPANKILTCDSTAVLELADTSSEWHPLNGEREKNEIEKSEAIVPLLPKHLEPSSTSEEEIHVSQMDPLHSNPCLDGGVSVSVSVETSNELQQHEKDVLNDMQDISIDCNSNIPMEANNDSRADELQMNSTEETHVGEFEMSRVSSPEQPGLTHLCYSSAVEMNLCQLLKTTRLC